MAKRLVTSSALLRYEQALIQEANEEEEYKEVCRVLFLWVLSILPQSAVDIIKAREDWATMDAVKDILALHIAVLVVVAGRRLELKFTWVAEGVSWRRDPTYDNDSTTDYRIDKKVGTPRPPASHSSFGCDSPCVPDKAGRKIAAKRVAVVWGRMQQHKEGHHGPPAMEEPSEAACAAGARDG